MEIFISFVSRGCVKLVSQEKNLIKISFLFFFFFFFHFKETCVYLLNRNQTNMEYPSIEK